MAAMWLGSYPNGLKRHHEKTDNGRIYRRLHLPAEPWLLASLHEHGHDDLASDVKTPVQWWAAMRVHRLKHSTHIHGLLRVRAGQALGDTFSLHSREEALLHKYFAHTPDAASLKVVEAHMFAGSATCEVYTDTRGNDIKMRHDICYLGSDLTRQMLQSGGTAASALQRWGIPALAWSEVPVVFVVEPIVLLVARLAFRTIVVRANKFVDRRDARRRLPGDDVGGVQDLVVKAAEAAGAHVAPPQEIHLQDIAGIADHLRGWAPGLLRRMAEEEEEEDGRIAEDRARLRWCLLQLDGLRASLTRRRVGQRFDRALLLNCMRMMMQVRNRNTLTQVVEKALHIALPELSNACTQSLASGQVPHGSTLSRAQPCLDAAILLTHKTLLEIGDWCIYLWADSSPQLSYNFFISTMLLISKENPYAGHQVCSRPSGAEGGAGAETPRTKCPGVERHVHLPHEHAAVPRRRICLSAEQSEGGIGQQMQQITSLCRRQAIASDSFGCRIRLLFAPQITSQCFSWHLLNDVLLSPPPNA